MVTAVIGGLFAGLVLYQIGRLRERVRDLEEDVLHLEEEQEQYAQLPEEANGAG